MSLFLGKDNDQNSVLHISKTEASLSYLKDYPALVNTAFHSDLKYLRVRHFKFAAYRTNVTYTSGGTTITLTGELDFSDEFLSYVATSSNAFFVTFKGNLVHQFSFLAFMEGYMSQFPCYSTSNFFNLSVYPTTDKRTTMASYPVGSDATTHVLDDFDIYVMNINQNGFIYESNRNNEIVVKHDSFLVKNVDLRTYDYLTVNKHNLSDVTLTQKMVFLNPDFTSSSVAVANTYLVLPSKHALTSMELKKTGVYSGDFKLFDSLLSGGNIQFTSIHEKYISYIDSALTTLISDAIFYDNELFSILNLFNSPAVGSPSNFFTPLRYVTGDIAYVGTFINFNTMDVAVCYLYGAANKLYMKFSYDIGPASVTATCRLVKFTS